MASQRPLSVIFEILERHWDFKKWWSFSLGKNWMIVVAHAVKKR